MFDLASIATIIEAAASLIGTGVGIATFRRSKQAKRPFTPTSTIFLGVPMKGHDKHLPTYDPGMQRLGVGRFNHNDR